MKDSENPAFQKIHQIADEMKSIKTKGRLLEFIAEILMKYDRYSLAVISARARDEVECLPEPYRTKLLPYAKEWFFGRYHRILLNYRRGDFKKNCSLISDPETFEKYCEMIPKACFDEKKEGHRFVDKEKKPLYDLFYYLLCAYAMFVEEEPGHPPGTPFPGGFEVTQNSEGYFCPIRDKEEDIFYSVCNFCPAKQDENNI
ncbi:DUF2115 domain-containing protein [Methanomicrobium antiquum]|uniref:UPF0305 protein L1994_11590 n=1 Tax=Methanomicrobium antiquum TaxID=487686 RepID=A0AAF0JMP3_9EURY|nr:DUF2115 domain-containing protein [Methanomicrobium antiquum]MDD3977740.1 DUF2115 domain-containing protein [Methanomicrobium sp.]WFN36760.1 DUF2115 domain-containing protein [Methanomicrobium antiquum]